ncbi:MAG: stress response protein ElaB, partial [Citrobacter sp.]
MSYQSSETHVDDDLTLLSETLEEVLRSSGDPADQKYVELKARAENALHEVKTRVSQASDSYYYRAKKAVYRADDYVREKP